MFFGKEDLFPSPSVCALDAEDDSGCFAEG